jgi:nucleoside-diphosphate-sugar epimerase
VKVVVTGSASHLAKALLPRLCAAPGIVRVTGVDLEHTPFAHERFDAVRADIRDPALGALLRGRDAIVHLAFVVLRGRMSEAEMSDVNLAGGRAVFRAAREAGMSRLVHLSSAAVYGDGAQLAETAPLAPLPGFLYARHKAELERWLEAECPECVRLRPHVVLGPNAQPVLRQLLALPCYPMLPDPQPRLQCVHEDDVARAVVLALERDVSGPFNLAVGDSFAYRDAVRSRHRHAVPVPPRAARAALELAWRIKGWGGEPGWLDGLARTLTLDCRRAAKELGWTSAHDAAAALAATPAA